MRSLALLTILALTLAACGSGGGGLPEGGTGTLKVMITDAPFPGHLVDSASVVIERVEARNTELGGWQTLFPPPVPDEGDGTDGEVPAEPAEPAELPPAEIDLVPLTGGVSELLVELQVPVGTYDEVRLIVQAGEVVLKEAAHVESILDWPASHTFNTENGALRFPSGAQTGIKVKIENDIVVTNEISADLVLDFDLAKNFVFNGSPDHAPGVKRVNFTPVVRATNETVNGSIRLQVESNEQTEDTGDDLPLPYPTADVYAVTQDEVTGEVATYVKTAIGDETGMLMVSALAPGTYKLDVMAQGYESAEVGLHTVILGDVTDAGTVTLDAALFWLGGQVLSDMGTPVAEPPAGGETDDDMVVAGATVAVWEATQDPDGEPALGTTTTDTGGGWFLTGLTPGTYVVRITAGGHEDAEVTGVIVVDWIPETVDVTLSQSTS